MNWAKLFAIGQQQELRGERLAPQLAIFLLTFRGKSEDELRAFLRSAGEIKKRAAASCACVFIEEWRNDVNLRKAARTGRNYDNNQMGRWPCREFQPFRPAASSDQKQRRAEAEAIFQ